MILFRDSSSLRKYITQLPNSKDITGFVPTMGALHNGHIALIEEAKRHCKLVISSIFVNPTQFNTLSDFEKYPATLEQDIYLLEKAGTDVLFLPSVIEIYPNGTSELESYDLGYLEAVLEGSFRPGHFQGVCQVMSRFLLLIQPALLFMGQKDYQQCMVVKRLLEQLPVNTKLIACPTIREIDGLAMSSRNKRLTEQQRKNAIGIYRALSYISQNRNRKSITKVKKEAERILKEYFFTPQYIEIAGSKNLEIIQDWNEREELVALIAAFQDDIRLIDNMLIN